MTRNIAMLALLLALTPALAVLAQPPAPAPAPPCPAAQGAPCPAAQGAPCPAAKAGPPPGPGPAAMVKAADADKDGKVTLEEFKAAAVKGAEKRFKDLDRNADGVLTPEDRPEGRTPPAKPAAARKPGQGKPRQAGPTPQERAEQAAKMKAADTDGDGRVSREEARAAFPKMTDERFKQMDRNGDGFLGPEDRAQKAPKKGKPAPAKTN